MRSPRRAVVVGALAGAVLLSACSRADIELERADPGPTGTAPAAPTVPPPATEPSTPTPPPPAIAWTPCGTAECATVPVPLDHDDPDGPTIELAVLRLAARGDRIGALFVNFGGPGSGTVSRLPGFSVPDAVRDRFDLVAVDPRGVGGSTPLACGVDPAALYATDHTIEDDADAAALVTISEDYAADCASRRGELLPHVGTRDVARDLDLIRAGMGDEQIDYLGYSYGTSIGQAYAELFPGRVRTMILDGIVDTAPSGLAVAAQQAVGFETALGRWAAACDRRDSCRLDDPVASVDQLLADAEDEIPSSGGSRPLGPGEAAIGLAMALYDEGFWPTLDRAVAAASAGDGAGLVALADQYLRLVDFSAYYAVSCLDSAWPTSTDEHLAAAVAAGERAPRFGEAVVNDYLRCAVWPAPPQPLGPLTAPGAPPILVVSTTGDPATPHENGVTVSDRLTSGVLLTHEGDGHTIVFGGDRCVDRIAVAYLVDRVVPADGARC